MKKRFYVLFLSILIALLVLVGCSKENHGLSKEQPTTVTVWHAYNGQTASAFDALVAEFNNTVGAESGVIVKAQSMGSLGDLEDALWDSVHQKTGSFDMPSMFQCYPETALALKEEAALVDFNEYVSEDEKLTYVRQFLDAGCIGADNAWNIFPMAASTEVLMLNQTQWDKFAAETGAELSALSTWEGLARTAEHYYEWSGGKAFFGRDAFANYPIIASSQLGHELFRVSQEENSVTLDFDKDTLRKIWDSFYVPYINGYYKQVGSFRCDDVRVGEVCAIVCSCASASYFPREVTAKDGKDYTIQCTVLPLPNFADTPPYATAQGAGIALTKSTHAKEYASVLFLKWFTKSEQNLRFCAASGYMPVSLEASQTDVMEAYLKEHATDSIIRDAILTSLAQSQKYVMYTPSAFLQGAQARAVIGHTMLSSAITDRETIKGGAAPDKYLSDERFDKWYASTLFELRKYCE